MDKLKIYEIVLDETDGITNMSLVEDPAVAIDFLKLSAEKPLQKYSTDEDLKIVTGVAILADTPIFRLANEIVKEDHYIVFTKKIIKDIVLKFFRDNKISEVNLEHKNNTQGIYLFESYLVNKETGVYPPTSLQNENIPDGSWIVSYKIDDDRVWDLVKSGVFNGFSIEGYFAFDQKLNSEDSLISDMKIIHSLLTKIVQF